MVHCNVKVVISWIRALGEEELEGAGERMESNRSACWRTKLELIKGAKRKRARRVLT